jgi:hypothetical protein
MVLLIPNPHWSLKCSQIIFNNLTTHTTTCWGVFQQLLSEHPYEVRPIETRAGQYNGRYLTRARKHQPQTVSDCVKMLKNRQFENAGHNG